MTTISGVLAGRSESRARQVGSETTTDPYGDTDGFTGSAVETLYVTHQLYLVRLAKLLVQDVASAEDVVQEAFTKLAARRIRLGDPAEALSYVRVMVINGARDLLRRRRTASAYVPAHEAPAAGPEGEVLLAEQHRELQAAVRALAPRQREVLVLRYWSDLTEAEISTALGISKGAVKSTASRAIAQLERAMGGTR